MGEAIVITSGKGGVGKTTICVNLGAALALKGKRVALVDTDIGLRNLDVVLGLEDKVVFDIVDVVRQRCRLKQALVQDPRFSGRLSLLPAAQTRDKEALTCEQMSAVCAELIADFEYVLIDCPAGIEQGFRNAVVGASRAIVVTMPDVAAVRDADRVIGLLEGMDMPPPQLILNRYRHGMVRRGDMMSVYDVTDVLGIPLLGIVPEEENVIRACNLGQPAALVQGKAAEAYRNIALRILGQNVPLQKQSLFFGGSSLEKLVSILQGG